MLLVAGTPALLGTDFDLAEPLGAPVALPLGGTTTSKIELLSQALAPAAVELLGAPGSGPYWMAITALVACFGGGAAKWAIGRAIARREAAERGVA
jgi:hypothetical protein